MIEFDRLTKNFKGVTALSELTLEIRDNELFGLLGPNGAGKSTSLMILCSILKPSQGTVRVNGADVTTHQLKVRKQLGIGFQEPVLDPRLTVQQNLEFHADACGIVGEERQSRVVDTLTYLDLWNDRKKKGWSLSGGTKKKLEDAKVFVQKPPVAIFDEPTAYLDVPTRHKVWKRILDLKEAGSTVILATNMMDEADRLCDRVGILAKGRLVSEGSPSNLKDAIPKGDVIEIRITGDSTLAAKVVGQLPEVKQVITLGTSGKIRIYLNQAEAKLPKIIELLLKE